MVSHIDSFFNPLTEKIKGKCDFEFYQVGKHTYITYRAANDVEVSVIVTTRFNPQNTVRIQLISDSCVKKQPKRYASEENIKLIEDALGVTLCGDGHKPTSAETAKNSENTYYKMMFPFVASPIEVIDNVAEALIKIFKVCDGKTI